MDEAQGIESLSPSRKLGIDAICDDFENAWKDDHAPDFTPFIARAGQSERAELVRELIALDVALCRAHHKPPRWDVYRSRFPHDWPAAEAALSQLDGSVHSDDQGHALASLDDTFSLQQGECDTSSPAPLPASMGRYEVRKRLGKGSFGVVYLARDPVLDRQVALKVPRTDRLESPEELQQYIAEARSASQLDHPGIVRIYDVQELGTTVYIVQQYVAGTDLRAHLATERLGPHRAAELLVRIADAIGHAHQRRFIHRDLKPANILLDGDLNPYIADFGLAIHATGQRTHKGELAGSPAYMSPEQVRGLVHRLDGRSDIWSLGVIFYEMLTGRRPFSGSIDQICDEILSRDPWPVRQLDPAIPPEIERICMTCLQKRAGDRYGSVADLQADLKSWLDSSGERPPALPEQPDAQRFPGVVPKGLRAFDREDAEFFLSLLPGPRDRHGLPRAIRFWKTKIEITEGGQTFPVGVLYGPSGCGKSSFIRAGLLPRLAPHVLPIYVEAAGDDIQTHVLRKLRAFFPEADSGWSLPQTMQWLRTGRIRPGQKVVLVVDQFEQWLHGGRLERDGPFHEALRHCDGGRLQCLLLVRDDFWMSLTRFMQQLEIRLVEDRTVGSSDLFDDQHATMVLAEFGRAYGCLPAGPLTPEQAKFLELAVDGLSDHGYVICIRLSLFADMMKGRPWSPEELKKIGGTSGVGTAFLEGIFGDSATNPLCRRHAQAAQAVLNALLPEIGWDIKGRRCTYSQLQTAAGYESRASDFAELLDILDRDTRLITPTDLDGDTPSEDHSIDAPRRYQLTHDYLVPEIRQWLARKSTETRRGRAELKLAEVSSFWAQKPENRHLPSAFELVFILMYTRAREWTFTQKRMICRSILVQAVRCVTVLLILGLLATSSVRLITSARRTLMVRMEDALRSVEISHAEAMPAALAKLDEFPEELLRQRLLVRYWSRSSQQRLPLAYALARYGVVEVEYLLGRVPALDASEASNVITALQYDKPKALAGVHRQLGSDVELDQREHIRKAIVALYLGDSEPAKMWCHADHPRHRSLWIDELARWHGSLRGLVTVCRDNRSPELRSALCLAIGSMDPETFSPDERIRWMAMVADLYRHEKDRGTHSAADYALRRWKFTLPAIHPTRTIASGWQWHRNGLGLTMIRIPAGTLHDSVEAGSDRSPNGLQVNEFLISDREISVEQFERFVHDKGYPADQKPNDWPGAYASYALTPHHPVQNVNERDAVMFCNWLSLQEGFPPAYRITGSQWQVIPDSVGYHVTSEVEWVYACQANERQVFLADHDVPLRQRYGVLLSSHPEACGSKWPNQWGLFDMAGNVWEWCLGQPVSASTSPGTSAATADSHSVFRGGNFGMDTTALDASHGGLNLTDRRINTGGFRVARRLSDGQ